MSEMTIDEANEILEAALDALPSRPPHDDEERDALAFLVAAAGERPAWVPCAERMPASGPVITCAMLDRKMVDTMVSSFDAAFGCWEGHYEHEPSHWMPIPPAPTDP